MATEQISTRQINQSGATTGQGLFWDGFNWVTSLIKMSFATVTVASSTASTLEKRFASYVCDGTDDDIEINLALQSVKTNGGIVQLSTGDFNLAASLYIEGDNDPTTAKNVGIVGVGSQSTRLITASNIDAIVLRYMPKPTVKDLNFLVSGSGCAIRSIANTTGSNDRRGFWQGEFRNLFISAINHTGWAMNLDSPFRSSFDMIQSGSGLANGIWLKSTYSGFNPGNCTFKNITMGLDVANGTAFRLWSDDSGGQMNLNTFEICDCIDANSSSTTSVGWDIRGSTTTYFSTKNNTIISSNVEGFNTGLKLVNASDNDINLTFANCKTGGRIVDFSSNSQRNKVQVRSGYVPPNETQYLFVDANNDTNNPNTIFGFNAYVDNLATLTCTPSTATIIKECMSSGAGTINPLLSRYSLPANQLQKVNVSATTPVDGQLLGFSSGEWRPTTLSGGGGTAPTISTISTDQNITTNNIYLVDASAGNITLTIVTPVTGQEVTIKKIDNTENSVFVTSPLLIDGEQTVEISTESESITLLYDTTFNII